MRARLTYLPLYELIWFIAVLVIFVITAASFVVQLIAPHLQNHFDWLSAFGIALVCGLLLFVFGRYIRIHWQRFSVNGEISARRIIGGEMDSFPLSAAKQIEVTTQIDAYHGLQTRAVLLLRSGSKETELQITRALLPHWPFRRRVSHFAQSLNISIYWNARSEIKRLFSLPDTTFPDVKKPPAKRSKPKAAVKVHDYVEQPNGRTGAKDKAKTLIRNRVEWAATGDAEYPFSFKSDDQVEWSIRVNDFPEYPTVYSLLANDKLVMDLESLPSQWQISKTPTVLSDKYRAECPKCGGDSGWNGESRYQQERLYLEMQCTRCGLQFENFDAQHQQQLKDRS